MSPLAAPAAPPPSGPPAPKFISAKKLRKLLAERASDVARVYREETSRGAKRPLL